jgi:hypothetical protein
LKIKKPNPLTNDREKRVEVPDDRCSTNANHEPIVSAAHHTMPAPHSPKAYLAQILHATAIMVIFTLQPLKESLPDLANLNHKGNLALMSGCAQDAFSSTQ